jgi:hypothetical protein
MAYSMGSLQLIMATLFDRECPSPAGINWFLLFSVRDVDTYCGLMTWFHDTVVLNESQFTHTWKSQQIFRMLANMQQCCNPQLYELLCTLQHRNAAPYWTGGLLLF